jgi:hypothetical protein
LISEEIFKANIASLAKNNVVAVQALAKLDFSQQETVFVEKTKTGLDSMSFNLAGKTYLLHSKYDPIAEAEKLVQSVEKTRDSLIVVFGIGLGYHLFALKDKISKDTRVLVVEHNLDILKCALTHIDLSPIFDTNQFLLIFGDKRQADELILYQAGYNFYNLVQSMKVVALPNYYVYGQENKQIMQSISRRLSSSLTAQGNSLEDVFVGFRNNCYNVDAIMKTNSIKEIVGKYQNVPAIIVAAGPSLDKNIHHLKEAYGKSLIIACDASMRACEKQGVQPDAVASIERDEPTYTYYYEGREFPKDVVLVGPGLLWPKIYEEYPGKTIMMTKTGDGIEEWWRSHFDNFEFVNQGYSSATVAFAVAKEAGCNPIILIGQDLAYSGGKKHSDLTHTEYEGENDDTESDDVYLEDSEGNLLRSHWVYKLFKNWFEGQILIDSELKVIDATEGGAYIQGTTLMTLEEAIQQYCTKPLEKHLVEHLADIEVSAEEKRKKYAQIIKSIDKTINKLNRIKKASAKHFNALYGIEKKLYADKCSEEQLEKIVLKMQPGDKIIQRILYKDTSILTFYKAIIVQTIIQVKKIGNELTVDNVKKNHLLQKNLMYILKDSTELIIKEYESAKEFIEQKKAAAK